MLILAIPAIIPMVLLGMFFLASKTVKWEIFCASGFECGFSSYFFSRFSFSIHFFMLGLVFLFLDLELCLLMPLMLESAPSNSMTNLTLMFVLALLLSLILEWVNKDLNWKA